MRTEQISGPGWMDEQRYEIIANVPAGSDDEQVRHMLRSLLAERFELQLHREKKTISVYALVVAKGSGETRIWLVSGRAAAQATILLAV